MKMDADTKSGKVAVLEEAADNIYSMRFILQSLGYEVASFPPKRGYLEQLKEFAPTVILVDMIMSPERGMRLLQELKESEFKKISVIAITADAVPFSAEDIVKTGADEVLSKPYSVSDLQEKLDK